ncbi:MAG: DUF3015 domain-containing protein [Bdellovibrionales bacterium]|nr:DUF3015 domain-containing protein [Bdellovibrionales bacterium]
MKKLLFAACVAAVIPASAMAQNVGKCGWGSKLMDGQSGIAPQVLAVTTNGTSGNQTFAITTGTSGCTQDGVVRSNWRTAMFIDENVTKIARDMSVGEGETLESLASLLGMNDADKAVFFQVAKENFEVIFPSDSVSSYEVMASLKRVFEGNDILAGYSHLI